MTTVLLVRHGRSTANTSGVLAGWTPGVHLDDQGRQQAAALAERLRPVPLTAMISSPLERCQETAGAILAERREPAITTDERLGECWYGDWNGQRLSKLAKQDLWPVVQAYPSGMTFPGEGGESLRDTQHRAVSAIHEWNARLGKDATYAVCTHGDVLKAIVADALGMHLDLFQRIAIDPASLTVVRYTPLRPFVLRLNDIGGDMSSLVPPPRQRRRSRLSKRAQLAALDRQGRQGQQGHQPRRQTPRGDGSQSKPGRSPQPGSAGTAGMSRQRRRSDVNQSRTSRDATGSRANSDAVVGGGAGNE